MTMPRRSNSSFRSIAASVGLSEALEDVDAELGAEGSAMFGSGLAMLCLVLFERREPSRSEGKVSVSRTSRIQSFRNVALL